eukprot:comp20940_c0_seq2/m.27984 comp20940_c0_seq2/g.27984  ORF comp20940_c0_seq2/g.27984 comp20940_c0_seq2/m.27984 type:complete len:470 (-) comp20940_c0_seq2:371-1780(-)
MAAAVVAQMAGQTGNGTSTSRMFGDKVELEIIPLGHSTHTANDREFLANMQWYTTEEPEDGDLFLSPVVGPGLKRSRSQPAKRTELHTNLRRVTPPSAGLSKVVDTEALSPTSATTKSFMKDLSGRFLSNRSSSGGSSTGNSAPSSPSEHEPVRPKKSGIRSLTGSIRRTLANVKSSGGIIHTSDSDSSVPNSPRVFNTKDDNTLQSAQSAGALLESPSAGSLLGPRLTAPKAVRSISCDAISIINTSRDHSPPRISEKNLMKDPGPPAQNPSTYDYVNVPPSVGSAPSARRISTLPSVPGSPPSSPSCFQKDGKSAVTGIVYSPQTRRQSRTRSSSGQGQPTGSFFGRFGGSFKGTSTQSVQSTSDSSINVDSFDKSRGKAGPPPTHAPANGASSLPALNSNMSLQSRSGDLSTPSSPATTPSRCRHSAVHRSHSVLPQQLSAVTRELDMQVASMASQVDEMLHALAE